MIGEIRNECGELLEYSFSAGRHGGSELVVIGHGVTANKDREWALTLSQVLDAGGLATLRFSFSGNGGSGGDFRDSCPTKEVGDLGAVLDVATERATSDWRVTYVGHSMGAAVGVLRAASDGRIRRLVSLAGMVDTAEFVRRKFSGLEPGVGCMWDKPECPLSQDFLDDMRAIGSVQEHAARVSIPWLLVHGSADTVVPFEESQRIAARAAGSVELIELKGADHVFSGDAARTMAAGVLAWLLGAGSGV